MHLPNKSMNGKNSCLRPDTVSALNLTLLVSVAWFISTLFIHLHIFIVLNDLFGHRFVSPCDKTQELTHFNLFEIAFTYCNSSKEK